MAIKYVCGDFLEFQESLKKMREVDDKIIYALNTSIPTESFKGQVDAKGTCEGLFRQLQVAHNEREQAIRNCIVIAADRVKVLREERDGNRDDVGIDKSFKAEQRKLRLLQSELNVEDIVKERTHKAFSERCRLFFKPDSL
ncbi:protein MIX23 [Phlebotomus argentipes]|uniref:protein MIX23 n=1 Tax=Phlebotomus argentipes TaxID=94469 RepID=UPI002892BFAA|nr:protein MIX23 [Phlebotomus argentipes]